MFLGKGKEMMKLEIRNATLGYHNNAVLQDVNLELSAGTTTCLIGRNGAGKTTLFKSLLGILPVLKGDILLDGKSILRWKCRDYARVIAYVPQVRTLTLPFTAFDVVLFGRTAHLSHFASPAKHDRRIADECLEKLQINHLRNRIFTQLSGGEQQMVIVARALAQQPVFLVMDEPASSLDFGNQIKIIAQVNRLKDDSLGILMATHSPDHAFMCRADVMVVHGGQIRKPGYCNRMITEKVLKEIYDADVCVCSVKGKSNETIRTCVPVMS
ncbi:MAG: ABC transporter ATP-binding protein [Tannerella sp.]|jgi:iron complex transport system ATP-binding protein|nr:ABC transporter ATP-binding protein [Tannerella sp.]